MTYTPLEQVVKGIGAYLDAELMPLLQEKSWKRVVYGAGIALFLSKAPQNIAKLKENPAVASLDIIAEDNSVDVDTIVTVLKNQLGTESMAVDIPGVGTINLKSADLDTIRNFITTAK